VEEPDLRQNPLELATGHNPEIAAHLWQVAQSVVSAAGCYSCTVVAGEFADYLHDTHYAGRYVNTILHSMRYWHGKPHVWGAHDYYDVVTYSERHGDPLAQKFLRGVPWAARLGSPHLWISEAGAWLNFPGVSGFYAKHCYKELIKQKKQSGPCRRQKQAGEGFLTLHSLSGARGAHFERAYYFGYRGPNREQLAATPTAFDSLDSLIRPESKRTFESRLSS
jgi:hypothetical protein